MYPKSEDNGNAIEILIADAAASARHCRRWELLQGRSRSRSVGSIGMRNVVPAGGPRAALREGCAAQNERQHWRSNRARNDCREPAAHLRSLIGRSTHACLSTRNPSAPITAGPRIVGSIACAVIVPVPLKSHPRQALNGCGPEDERARYLFRAAIRVDRRCSRVAEVAGSSQTSINGTTGITSAKHPHQKTDRPLFLAITRVDMAATAASMTHRSTHDVLSSTMLPMNPDWIKNAMVLWSVMRRPNAASQRPMPDRLVAGRGVRSCTKAAGATRFDGLCGGVSHSGRIRAPASMPTSRLP